MLRLRTINRWLRWTGFCMVVGRGEGTPTIVGFEWRVLPGTKAWRSTAKELSV